MPQFFKIRVVLYTLYLWNEFADPQFFHISDTINSLSDCRKNLKMYRVKNFYVNVLNKSLLSYYNSENSDFLVEHVPPNTVILFGVYKYRWTWPIWTWLKLEFLVILNSKSFPLHNFALQSFTWLVLSVISNFHYFELFSFPLRVWNGNNFCLDDFL